MSGSAVVRLEAALAQRFGRSHAVVVSSGTAAMFCAFDWLRQRSGETEPTVLFPETTCETAVNAAVFAGCTPVFCDVDAGDALMDAATAHEVIEARRPMAVVPTHIYGHLADAQALRERIDPAVWIIEDAAQGYGGQLGAQLAGAMGDASAISFGVGKLLDCGAGGALLCDNEAMAHGCREIAATLPLDGHAVAGERAQLMVGMFAARKAHRSDRAALLRAQWQLLRRHRTGYVGRCGEDQADRILRSLGRIDGTAAARETLRAQLDLLLQGVPGVRVPSRAGRSALWRYTFFVDDASLRDTTAEQLQRSGLEVSKLFAPCSRKFAVEALPHPRAAQVASTVLNLQFPSDPAQHARTLAAVEQVFC